MEYELLDTGVFEDDRYFDVFVEYAKASPEDILIQISVHNRGPESAELHLLPTLWFRNEWSWGDQCEKPVIEQIQSGSSGLRATDVKLGERYLYVEGTPSLLFTENETNTERLYGVPNQNPCVKDSINNHIVHGQADVLCRDQKGTKAAAHYQLSCLREKI
jgi:hypothetical protein